MVSLNQSDLVTMTATQILNLDTMSFGGTSEFALDSRFSPLVVTTNDDPRSHDEIFSDLNTNLPVLTLRQAILNANVMPNSDLNGSNTIIFRIPGSGIPTITPNFELTTITDPVIIDGRSSYRTTIRPARGSEHPGPRQRCHVRRSEGRSHS